MPDTPLPKAPGPSKAKPQSTRQRRSRAVQWTKRKPTIAHLYQEVDEALTRAIRKTGLGLQDTFEIAINQYCDRLQPPIPAEMPEDADLAVPRDPNETPGAPLQDPTAPPAVVRLLPNTRARLVAACRQEVKGGKQVINEAITDYLAGLTLHE